MLITQEEIELAVQQFIQSAIRYEGNVDFAVRDHADTFDQVKETVIIQLLLDPNAVYYLLSLGARDQGANLQELTTLLSEVEDLLPALKHSAPPDLVEEAHLAKVESVLRNQFVISTDTTVQALDDLTMRVGKGLIRDGALAVPIEDAREQITTKLDDLEDLYAVLLEDLDNLNQGFEDFAASTALAELEQRVLGAAQSLLFDMRLERVDPNPSASQRAARERVVELQAAKLAILQLTKNADSHSTDRVLSGQVPEGTDLRLYPRGPAVAAPSQVMNSGGFPLTAMQTLIVSANMNIPHTVTFEKTSEVNLIGKGVPTPAAAGEALYFSVNQEEFEDVPSFPAEVVTPTAYLGGPPPLGTLASGYLSASVSDAIVGHVIGLRYSGDLAALTADQKKAVEATVGTYRVIGYDGRSSLATPVLKLDPPLPSLAVLTGWEFFSLGLFMRWEAPTDQGAYPTYLDRLIAELSGPTDPANVDAYQPWRIHTFITGTITGTFRPGERVVNTSGTPYDRQGIVVYQDAGGLYVLEMADPFLPGDDLQGYESGATLTTVTSVQTQVAERAGNSGAVNQARYVEALSSSVLHLRGRAQFGGGADASITGSSLVIGPGDRGLWEMGLWNGSKINVGAVEYTIDEITDNKTATIVGTASQANQAWYVPVPSPTVSINMPTFGPQFRARLFDASGLIAAAPASGYTPGDAFALRTLYTDGAEFRPANSLQLDLPAFDAAASMSAQEVIEEINAAQIPGVVAQEVREVIYSHPEQSAPLTLTQGSNSALVATALPSDSAIPDLTGYYLVPEEGAHKDTAFLIEADTPGPRTLTFDRSARVTEVIPAYRIEARRPSLSGTDLSPESRLVFGAGTAHAALGLPINETVYGTYNTWELRQDDTPQDLDELNLIRGDKISSPDVSFDEVSILELDEFFLTLETALSGALAGSTLRVEGECPAQWTAFTQAFRLALGELRKDHETTENLRLAAFPLLNSELSVQESDLATFRRQLISMKTAAEGLLSVIQSLNMPDVAAGRRIVESLEEYNYDATLFQLTNGRYDEFFLEGSEQATRPGRIQSLLSLAQTGLGENDQSQRYEEFSDTPLIVTPAEDEEDERDGAGFDQFFDDEDTGDGGISE